MSMAEQAPEPSMEEILSSIRDAINEDKTPASTPSLSGNPFSSTQTAAAAAPAQPAQAAPAAEPETSKSSDPFAELTRRLHETRESVQRQMQKATSPSSSPLQPSHTLPIQSQPAPEPAAPTPPPPAQAQPAPAGAADHQNEFSRIVENLSRAAPAVAEQPAAPPPAPTEKPAQFGQRQPADSATDEKLIVDAVLRRIIEPAVKSWLDENLTRLVTETVRDEMQKAAAKQP